MHADETRSRRGRPERILVLGAQGAGKTTLSRAIARSLDIPVIHLDREFWLPGFVKPSADVWLDKTRELSLNEQWVMDGGFLDTIEFRLERASVVIWIDLSRWLCIVRIVLRTVRNYGRTREDLGEGLIDKLRIWQLRNAFSWHKTKRPQMQRVVSQAVRDRKVVFVVTSVREVNDFVAKLPRVIVRHIS